MEKFNFARNILSVLLLLGLMSCGGAGRNGHSSKHSGMCDKEGMAADGITPLVAFSYLIFVLLYFPCLATIAAIKGESGSWRWAAFAAAYTTALAWVVSAAVYQVGRLFIQ